MDSYSFWRAQLAHQAGKGEAPPLHEADLGAGFYRMRRGDSWEPIAIWRDAETAKWVAVRGAGLLGHPVALSLVWPNCARNAIAEEVYTAVVAGKPWPDDAPPKPNRVETGDPWTDINEELLAEMETAAELLAKPLGSEDDAGRAAAWKKRFNDIAKRAEAARKAEKEPHLRASEAVDAKWNRIIPSAKTFVEKLAAHLLPWMQRKQREEFERVQREQEAAAALAAKATEEAEHGNLDKAEALAEEANKVAVAAKVNPKAGSVGRTGAKVAIRKTTRGRIVDYEKALLAMKNHGEVKALVQTLADRAAKAGVPVEGVEFYEEEKAV